MTKAVSYPCPVCGFLVFHEPAGSYDICPVCDWEDDGVQLANPTCGGGANRESLAEGQVLAVHRHPLAIREMDGMRREDGWRPLSTAEITLCQEQVDQIGYWPNKATEDYYWRSGTLGFETVFTMTDYYDGPREGVASHGGRPHHYLSAWDEHGSGPAAYWLRPVDPETLRLTLEDWYIWLRWELAFKRGETTTDTHPALPTDRGRHDELTRALAARLPPTGEAIQASGEFSAPPGPGDGTWRGLAVRWSGHVKPSS